MKLITRNLLALTLCGAMLQSVALAQPGGKGERRGGPRRGEMMAMRQAEMIAGKPLTATQKTALRAAVARRRAAMKPIQERFQSDVAKALGLTVAQLEAKEKATRDKMRANRGNRDRNARR